MSADKMASSIKLLPDDVLLNTAEYERRYKRSRASQCRDRKKGNSPPWIELNGIVYYPERLVLEWYNARLVTSSNQLPENRHGGRYNHLEGARQKALEKVRQNHKASVDRIVSD